MSDNQFVRGWINRVLSAPPAGTDQAAFETWFQDAGPRDTADFLRGVAEGIASAPGDARQLVRQWTGLWNSLILNAEISVSVGDIEDSISRRMAALAREMLAWDPSLLLIDFSLFDRGKAEDEGDETVRLRHVVAARDIAPDRASFHRSYIDALKAYAKSDGSSIKFEGHLQDGVRYSTSDDFREESAPVPSPGQVAAFSNTRLQLNPRANGFGDDRAFLSSVVRRSLAGEGADPGEALSLVHVMEGIDVSFLGDDRSGAVAHMFLVYPKPADRPAPDSPLLSYLRTMLLRLCGFYAALSAQENEKRARVATRQAESQADAARNERNLLIERARRVSDAVQNMEAAAESLALLLQNRPFLDNYNAWLNQVGDLFRTSASVSDRDDLMEVKGDHNQWRRQHVAAAAWLLCEPRLADNFSREAQKASKDPIRLWNAFNLDAEEQDYLDNDTLLLLSRLDNGYSNPGALTPEALLRAHATLKRWNANIATKDRQRRNGYNLSEIRFLLGDSAFDSLPAVDDAEFRFRTPDMLFGLSEFTKLVDRSGKELGGAVDEARPTAKLIGGVQAVHVGLLRPTEVVDKVRGPLMRYLGDAPAWLNVQIIQNRRATDGFAQRLSPGAEVIDEERAQLFKRLIQTVQGWALTEPDGGQSDASHIAAWRRRWTTGARNETSRSAAQALGFFASFAGEHDEAVAAFAEAKPSRVRMPSGVSVLEVHDRDEDRLGGRPPHVGFMIAGEREGRDMIEFMIAPSAA